MGATIYNFEDEREKRFAKTVAEQLFDIASAQGVAYFSMRHGQQATFRKTREGYTIAAGPLIFLTVKTKSKTEVVNAVVDWLLNYYLDH